MTAAIFAFCGRFLIVDEDHFLLTSNVNSINFVYWADNNHHDVFSLSLHEENVSVLYVCGITSTFIISPYFLEEVTAAVLQACTYSNECSHVEILTNYVISNVQQRNALSDVVCVQYNPHMGSFVKMILNTTVWV